MKWVKSDESLKKVGFWGASKRWEDGASNRWNDGGPPGF